MTAIAERTRPEAALGQRGPVDHQRREQIIQAADEHFRRYGYNKTTVADLANAIGLSTAYIYKFFESKQAIGEAICALTLGRITAELRKIADERKPAADRLRRVYLALTRQGAELFFNERKLHDIAAVACSENWRVVTDYRASLQAIIRELVTQGRKTGEFERETPGDEVCRAILQTMEPFSQPLFLEQNLDDLDARATSVANLVVRSLAP